RLTRVQLLFTRNLSPLQSSKFSFEYLLLPPRSALEAVRPGSPQGFVTDLHACLLAGHKSCPAAGMVTRLSAIHFQG
ncbi:hypothetical protein EJ07DRAFT_148707, partial [Lizonia empirigonia]